MKIYKTLKSSMLLIMLLVVGTMTAQLPNEPSDPDGSGEPLNPTEAPIDNYILVIGTAIAVCGYVFLNQKSQKQKIIFLKK
jgi:hypothetical protein